MGNLKVNELVDVKYKFTRSALWFCTNDEVTMAQINKYFTNECFNQLVQYGYIIPVNE